MVWLFSSLAIILRRKRELVALLKLGRCCLCSVPPPHFAVDLSAFPVRNHLLFVNTIISNIKKFPNCRPTHGTARENHRTHTATRHSKDN